MSYVSSISKFSLAKTHNCTGIYRTAQLLTPPGLRYGLGKYADAVAPEKIIQYLKVPRTPRPSSTVDYALTTM